MNNNLQKYNNKRRRDTLAEKIFLAMMSNSTSCRTYYPEKLINEAYKLADAFIKKQEETK